MYLVILNLIKMNLDRISYNLKKNIELRSFNHNNCNILIILVKILFLISK